MRGCIVFGCGLLFYALSQGFAYTAFSALALHVGAESATKYAILISLGNIPVAYMTAFLGFAHDRWGSGGMLIAEALLGVTVAALGLSALWRMRRSIPGASATAGF